MLLVAFGGSFLNSFYILRNGPGAAPEVSNVVSLAHILKDLTALALLVYVLSRHGLGLRHLGLRWSVKDAGVGLLVAGVSYAAWRWVYTAVQFLHYYRYGFWAHAPRGSWLPDHPSALAVPLALLNPLFEELIVRAYLMTEVSDLTGSSGLAVAFSVLVQFSYHLYQGWLSAISLSFLFLTLALYYSLSKRVLPVIVAHALFDIGDLIRHW